MKKFFAILLVFSASFGLASAQTPVSRFNNDIIVSWDVKENNHQDQVQFLSSFTIINKGQTPLTNNWAMYFNYVRTVKYGSYPASVKIEHVNGDFFKMTPTTAFKTIKTGDSLVVPFVSSDWAINYCDAPAGVYVVLDNKNDQPQIIKNYIVKPFVSPAQLNRFSGDKAPIPTAESIYTQNLSLTELSPAQIGKIIPSPVVYKEGIGSFTMTAATKIEYAAGLAQDAKLLAEYLKPFVGKELAVKEGLASSNKGVIQLSLGNVRGAESYKLSIGQEGITIVGQDGSGVGNGIQSIRSLIAPASYKNKAMLLSLPVVEVEDAPRFGYRGMHLDVARSFQTKESVLRLVDLIALYKLNKFHFHVTDDEGWRVEIPGLPELTEVGSKRGHTVDGKDRLVPSFGSGPFVDEKGYYGTGFYTRADFIEILKYANARHIEVILEVDVPGHARGAIKSMDARYEKYMKLGNKEEATKYLLRDLDDKSKYESVQLWNDNVICPCQPSVITFYDKVIGEFSAMYKEAGAPMNFFHIGGDEVPKGVWERSALCQKLLSEDQNMSGADELYSYFMGKMNTILKKYNLRTAGWEEIALVKVKDEAGNLSHQPNPAYIKEGFVPYTWNNVWGWGDEDNAYKLANAGYDVVLSNVTNLYFDLSVSKDPREIGYYWGGFVDVDKPYQFIPEDFFKSARENRMGSPLDQKDFVNRVRLTPEGQKHIIGLQGQLWSENQKGRETMEYMIFPKLMGLAERAWAPQPVWATDKNAQAAEKTYHTEYNKFINQLGQRELPKLDFILSGVNYRIPTPGGKREAGSIKANMPYPGFTIRYTLDGTEPTAQSPAYKDGIKTDKRVKLRAFDSRGRGGFSVEVK